MSIKYYLDQGVENSLFQKQMSFEQDWGLIQNWSDQVYLPFQVRPTGEIYDPTAYMSRINIGQFILTRFTYGIPVEISKFSENCSRVLLLTTIHGHARHKIDKTRSIVTGLNQSYIMDSSYPDDYAFLCSEDNIQLNLSIPKHALQELTIANFGHDAPLSLWQSRSRFDGDQASWMALLHYVYHCLKEIPEQALALKAGQHLQQMMGLHIINAWARRENIDLNQPIDVAPHHIKRAVEYIYANYQYSPTIVEIAQAVGVSIRTLSSTFKRHQQMTVGQMLRKVRLEQVRARLLAADAASNVMDIAYACGYINLGDFAKQYKQKYGELPSTTIKRN
ncbi:AraC family transcriptional regulator [Acinetobacter rudis]|uniref:AraC family transcriptional regulator n=1 Tax=Acinetobacter rudis TaxID=632955 RepID=UPI00280F54C7|nr:AraC family transcriptional regulator [Acinetobacter rudis]MDQ8952003.1 AraC family transcriptional regulator [Acinetobacter rudis]